jgi:bifunctional non-homologous end joining protein LigD
MAKAEVTVETVRVTHPERVLFPGVGLRKLDLVEYYRRIGAVMLPHLRDRPVMLHRFPRGIGRAGFYQKEVPDSFPRWIRRASVEKEGGRLTHAVCDNVRTLVYLANQGCVTLHTWPSRADRPRQPDRMIFDLDPSREDFAGVREAALALRGLLDELGLAPFLMTSGSRGLHVVVPLRRGPDFDEVRALAFRMARVLVERQPRRLTVEARKEKRRGRLYLDVLRNAYAQTSVAPYAVRAKPGAPVAAPIAWAELDEPGMGPQRHDTRSVFEALERRGDPWQGIGRHGRSLARAEQRLG